MRRPKVNDRTFGNDTGWIDGLVAFIIMLFNMLQINRFGDTRLLVKITQIFRKVWVISNAPDITLEMSHINHIKTDQPAKLYPTRMNGCENDEATELFR